MDTNTVGFNLNRIYSLRNKSGDSFSVSAFNGSISFTVFKPDDRAPSIKIGISLALSIEIAKQLKKLLASDVAQRLPIVIQKFNPTTKGYENSDSITLVKNDKKICSIELISAKGASAAFDIRSSTIYSDGTSPMAAEYRSAIGVQEFITVLDKMVPQAMINSTFGTPRRGGASSGQSNKFGGQASAPKVSDPFTDDSFSL